MYDVIPEMIDSFPDFIRQILQFVTSGSFAVALVVCLMYDTMRTTGFITFVGT